MEVVLPSPEALHPAAPAAPLPRIDEAFRHVDLPVPGHLAPYVSGLMGFEIGHLPPMKFSIVPHESMMLTVQFGRGQHCIEQKGPQGENMHLTGIRHWTGCFSPAGNCVTLFALLTPLGAMALLDSQPLASVPRIRARVGDLLEHRITRELESKVALAHTLGDKLRTLGSWLEGRASMHRRQARAAMRAARAAMRLRADPMIDMEVLAGQECVSRRQLERDFAHWIGTSPRHLAQVARVQAVSRLAHQGAGSLADIAVTAGFADQSHMSRVVRQLTGLTPQRFLKSCMTPMSSAFRAATGGGTVYL